MQPYQAVKAYRCPGCDHEIPPGLGHEVVVPARRARGPPPLAHRRAGTASRAPRSAQLRTRASITSITGSAPRTASTDATSKRSVARRAPGARPATAPPGARMRRCFVARDRLDRRAERGRRAGSSPRRTRRRGRARRTRSSSPSRQRQLRSSDLVARRPRTSAATASSPAPPERASARGRAAHGSQVLAGELLDVDVLERHDPDVGDEARRAVHVPHPGVAAARARSRPGPARCGRPASPSLVR